MNETLDPKALEALARAYDREDASQRGEPDPWDDGAEDQTWRAERLACAKAAMQALAALSPCRIGEETEEAIRTLTNCAQIIDVVKGEWGKAGAWSAWDQSVRDDISKTLAALCALRSSLSRKTAGEAEPERSRPKSAHARTSPGPINCNLRLKMQGHEVESECERCDGTSAGDCLFFFVDGQARDVPLASPPLPLSMGKGR